MKKIMSYLCAAAVALGLVPSETSAAPAEYISQSLVGQVVSVAEDTLTLTLGNYTLESQKEQFPESGETEQPREGKMTPSSPRKHLLALKEMANRLPLEDRIMDSPQ